MFLMVVYPLSRILYPTYILLSISSSCCSFSQSRRSCCASSDCPKEGLNPDKVNQRISVIDNFFISFRLNSIILSKQIRFCFFCGSVQCDHLDIAIEWPDKCTSVIHVIVYCIYAPYSFIVGHLSFAGL